MATMPAIFSLFRWGCNTLTEHPSSWNLKLTDEPRWDWKMEEKANLTFSRHISIPRDLFHLKFDGHHRHSESHRHRTCNETLPRRFSPSSNVNQYMMEMLEMLSASLEFLEENTNVNNNREWIGEWWGTSSPNNLGERLPKASDKSSTLRFPSRIIRPFSSEKKRMEKWKMENGLAKSEV